MDELRYDNYTRELEPLNLGYQMAISSNLYCIHNQPRPSPNYLPGFIRHLVRDHTFTRSANRKRKRKENRCYTMPPIDRYTHNPNTTTQSNPIPEKQLTRLQSFKNKLHCLIHLLIMRNHRRDILPRHLPLNRLLIPISLINKTLHQRRDNGLETQFVEVISLHHSFTLAHNRIFNHHLKEEKRKYGDKQTLPCAVFNAPRITGCNFS